MDHYSPFPGTVIIELFQITNEYKDDQLVFYLKKGEKCARVLV